MLGVSFETQKRLKYHHPFVGSWEPSWSSLGTFCFWPDYIVI